MTEVLKVSIVNGYLAHKQHLLPASRLPDVVQVTHDIVALHATAATGLAALCYLAADHTPAKAGPHQQTIDKAMKFLVASVRPDGDLRGDGDMYDQAIATLALAEAALMTGDPRLRRAAIKGAQFIIRAQNPTTGGWRYRPGDPGDTSVLGWQVMALYSVEKLGYKIPSACRQGCFRWLRRVSNSRHGMICGYQGPSPRPSMTAEATFSYLLLGKKLSQAEIDEACEYILSHPYGGAGRARGRRTRRGRDPRYAHNYYYWYYAFLSLFQMQNEAWKKWNARMRELLISLQKREGAARGSWEPNSHYGLRGGRIYTTTLATLCLEVYSRYLPMYGRGSRQGGGK